MVDAETGDRIYLGGVSGASGESSQIVHSIDRWQRIMPVLKVNCFDNGNLHGSGTAEFSGGSVLIPPRFGGGGGSNGSGGGGGGGGGQGGSDPTEPLRNGGCIAVVVGTGAADEMTGGASGEAIFGLGKGDAIRGGEGDDCLLGGSGADRLRGEAGFDRLTGGAGADRLVDDSGVNAFDAGRGNDWVDAVNGRRELVRCGPGNDRARVDRADRVRGCERLTRAPG